VTKGGTLKTLTKTDYQAIWDEAQRAGVQAATAHQPTPMVVYEAHGLTDTPIKGGKEWFVEGGVCGFAWVNIKPARGKFVTWLKAQGIGRLDGYQGGWTIWIGDYGQSMERKHAHAVAVVEVLRKYGINADAYARMD
jgi:hypothetical protein